MAVYLNLGIYKSNKMKFIKYLSITSIILALVIIFIKLQFDIESYRFMKEIITDSNGDISPTVGAGGLKILILLFIPMFISLVISIIGFKKKNIYKKASLILNIITMVYLIIPAGILLSQFSF